MQSNLPPRQILDIITYEKILHLQQRNTRCLHLTTPQQTLQNDEHLTLYHIIRLHKRQRSRRIDLIIDAQNVIHTKQAEIIRTFTDDLKNNTKQHEVNIPAIQYILQTTPTIITPIENTELLQPITMEELNTAIINSPTKKSPGTDGICSDFYRITATFIQDDLLEVLNTMFTQCRTAPHQTDTYRRNKTPPHLRTIAQSP